jgi:hypothetical protein
VTGNDETAGVFCLEGEWDAQIEGRESVLPILEVLEQLEVIRFVHRNAHTTTELEHHIARWTERGQSFDLVYMAFHGSRAGLSLSEGHDVARERLAILMEGAGKGAGIHFGTCSVLRRSDTDLEQFISATGARMICGYTRNVDWVDSAAFDLALVYNPRRRRHPPRRRRPPPRSRRRAAATTAPP